MRALSVAVILAGGLGAACVPDFVYGGGTTSAAGGGDGGGDGGAPGGTTAASSRAAVGVGGSSSVGPGPGPGPGPSSVASVAGSAGSASSAGGGDVTTSTSSTSAATGGGPEGVPCWNGPGAAAVRCSDAEVCCYDLDDPAQDQCAASCTAGAALVIECNDVDDCDGALCCVTGDYFFGDFDTTSITCAESCAQYVACSSDVPCAEGTCYFAFDPDTNPAVYDTYGVCLLF